MSAVDAVLRGAQDPFRARARGVIIVLLLALVMTFLALMLQAALSSRKLVLDGQAFEVIGIYSTENDFGDNHVFLPLEAFRAAFKPGGKLSKIFVTVDSVANVERVVSDLKSLTEADVVTTPEAVSTARTTLAGLAQASAYGAALLFAIGAALAARKDRKVNPAANPVRGARVRRAARGGRVRQCVQSGLCSLQAPPPQDSSTTASGLVVKLAS